ncbi:hypothetical protein B0T18DRAFT_438612 [Schizothecium vesticola]|uniref:Uncharacterized protein n=1 Tax=Schizothecium vesticola TaxID=314040 RepID=A0AA40EWA8_9PEZI|nr:hypothetical protein B0T18DRAFT_438612 [Schizothecium vesticola]
MAKKKRGAALGEPKAASASPSPSPSSSPSPVPPPSPPLSAAGSSSTSIGLLAPKTSSTGQRLAQQQPQGNPAALIICRNKHWRFISSFHGPWLQLPPEVLENLAHCNYNAPRPRPIDPSVFFDLVKIRRLVDDATNLCVKAATGVASLNPNGGNKHGQALGLGIGGGGQTKLSTERKHRMREQATQKLAKAYRIDEIACSVATMQSASPLEDVASIVQARHPDNPDAKYVHFFHEKIPSRKLAESTSLDTLNEVITERPTDPEPFRTRATVRIFKDDYEGALADLTEALRLHRMYRPPHTDAPSSQELQLAKRSQQRNGWRPDDIILKDELQPSSLEIQLLFQRAGVYLTLAWRQVAAGLADSAPDADGHPTADADAGEPAPAPDPNPAQKAAQRTALEARQSVRQYAKRALRDYTAFISHFDYSPDLSVDIADHFARKVNYQVNGIRYVSRVNPHLLPTSTIPRHRVFPLSTLFTAAPPPQTSPPSLTPSPPTRWKPPKLLRHAYMVARLTRLSDGYPVFQASRSPARADWVELVRAAIPGGPVPEITAPRLAAAGVTASGTQAPAHVALPALLPLMVEDTRMPGRRETARQREERIHQEAVLEALGDERVVDGDTLEQAIEVRKRRAVEGGGAGGEGALRRRRL